MNSITTLLGMAARAGRLVSGTAAVEAGLKRQQVLLVICATDLAPRTIRNFSFWCEKYHAGFFCYGTRSELGKCIGRPERGLIGVTGVDFAGAIRSRLEEK
ncbi:MAG TPA: ribosomal L7Ae/L30e/S12e/Gadd45 family protein [Bacillota bacterium]